MRLPTYMLLFLTVFGCRGAGQAAKERTPYALDSISRIVPSKGALRCPSVPKVRYRGKHIRYHKPVTIYSGFRPHLIRFESKVREVALKFYGRPPTRIIHYGTYNCRRIRGWSSVLSEHALGNAIDVAGFDFGPERKEDAFRLQPRLRRPFKVRLKQHYFAKRGVGATHSRFLKALRREIERSGTFRVVLGPGDSRHSDHFHLDYGPTITQKLLMRVNTLVARVHGDN
jgi:hypothetical protein